MCYVSVKSRNLLLESVIADVQYALRHVVLLLSKKEGKAAFVVRQPKDDSPFLLCLM